MSERLHGTGIERLRANSYDGNTNDVPAAIVVWFNSPTVVGVLNPVAVLAALRQLRQALGDNADGATDNWICMGDDLDTLNETLTGLGRSTA